VLEIIYATHVPPSGPVVHLNTGPYVILLRLDEKQNFHIQRVMVLVKDEKEDIGHVAIELTGAALDIVMFIDLNHAIKVSL